MNIKNTNAEVSAKTFIEIIKNTRWELAYKLAITYFVSKREILNLSWDDIDFDNNTITFYAVKHIRNNKYNYQWIYEKQMDTKRTYPLLDNIRELLVKNLNGYEYVFTIDKKKRITANTLGRNLKTLMSENNIDNMNFENIREMLKEKFLQMCDNNDFYLCWTRFDIKERNKNIYKSFNLTNSKKLIKNLNNLIEHGKEITRKNEIEM